MVKYINSKIHISEGQKEKIKQAINRKCDSILIRLGHKDLKGEDNIALTQTQINKLTKALHKGTGVQIRMSKSQLQYNKKIDGGFLPILAGVAAKVLPALGMSALTGLLSGGIQKAIGNGLYLKKGGNICKVKVEGEGMFLQPYHGQGLASVKDGLHVIKDKKIVYGEGLLLGPNSPFKKVPLLNILL